MCVIVRNRSKPNDFLDIYISIDGGGHAVLDLNQPKPPIQKNSTSITPSPGLKTPQNLKTPLPSPSKLLFFKFELVFPSYSLSAPECPFEVANTPGGTIADALVENVFVI